MKKITIDGNTAAAHIAYACNDMAFIYPITPSSPMSELCDRLAKSGEQNVFGDVMTVTEMQSEGGAAGALHGALSAGGIATTFTSSQGLLLMIPNMYKIAGEQLPCVIYVAARSIATHALNIFCDHSDIYAMLKTGFNVICCSSVQEVNDLALVAQIATMETSLPYVLFFDGFRTSHEINTIQQFERSEIESVLPYDAISALRSRGMNTLSPFCKGTAQNPDVFFQNRISALPKYKQVPLVTTQAMQKINAITGADYHTLDYYGSASAENVVIILGSAVNSCKDAVRSLGDKDGLVVVRLLAPFDSDRLKAILPKTTKTITVLERNADFTMPDSLYSCVNDALSNITILRGVYGLGGKEFTPDMAISVYINMSKDKKDKFTIGIDDDVSHTSLKVDNNYTEPEHQLCVRIYGVGSDGSVSASKNLSRILANLQNGYSQSYFEYDSKKSGSTTISHIRTSNAPIHSSYNSLQVDCLMVNNLHLVNKFLYTLHIKNNGILIINSPEEVSLPLELINGCLAKNVTIYSIDANKVAHDCGLGNKINNIMVAAFLRVMSKGNIDKSFDELKSAVHKSLASKGDIVISNNINAINITKNAVNRLDLQSVKVATNQLKEYDNRFYNDIMKPIADQNGNNIPVSSFTPDGKMPTDTTKMEKRGIAEQLPCWNSESCIQCNRCVMACPHAAIRSKLISQKPKDITSAKAFGFDGQFCLQVSPLDCTGCGVCASVCPTKQKSITMQPYSTVLEKSIEDYNIFSTLPIINHFDKNTVKGSQFLAPYFEFSGACAGCGETPYIKLVTQLFGDRMLIANATGCSSIYGASFPSCPYSRDKDGFGPSWANSLFEDNAEYGLGIATAKLKARNAYLAKLKISKFDPSISTILNDYLKAPDNNELAKSTILALKDVKHNSNDNWLFDNISLMQKPSIWIIGGDGWAYDIGFGGLDHVFASGIDINILVLDTEVYSNTGGQTSKSTQRGSVASFSASGKRTKKKDLAAMALTYGDVYVASVGLGADPNQLVQAVVQAENYDGVSIIFAYAPCINHGFDMSHAQEHIKMAVDTGYISLFRYDPRTPSHMTIDSPEPSKDISELWNSENRYKQLIASNADLAARLLAGAKEDAAARRRLLKTYKIDE